MSGGWRVGKLTGDREVSGGWQVASGVGEEIEGY